MGTRAGGVRSLTAGGLMLVTAVLSCSGCSARVQTPSRIQALASAQPDTARMFALLQEEAAESDGTLAAILAVEGKPDRIDVNHWNTGDHWAVEVQLYYGASRRLVVLRRDLNQPWYTVRNEVVSRLAAYKDKDTIEAYEEYLRLFPDDPADALAFARSRIDSLRSALAKLAARQAALAKLEQFIRTQPHGNDIAEVYRALEARSQVEAKGEFESTQAHRERVAAAQTRPLLGGLAMDAPFVFEVQKESVTYNADTQQLEIALKFGPVWNGSELERNAESLPSRSRNHSGGSYIATNAFGAVVDVSTSSVESYELVVKNVDSLPTRKEMPEDLRESYERARRSDAEMRRLGIQSDTASTYESSQERFLRTTLSLGPDDAKRVKENLRVFAISRLAPPFTSKGWLYFPATFDSPSESSKEFYYVHVEVIALWFYDPATHRVLARVDG